MQLANITLGVAYIFSGVLMILLSLPLLKDKIGPNRWYGVRIKKSFESHENWFKINRYGAKQLIIWSGVIVACGIVALLLPLSDSVIGLLGFLPAVIVFIPLIQILRYAKTL